MAEPAPTPTAAAADRAPAAGATRNSPRPRRAGGLSELAGDYRALLCDVWGVVHNGLRPFAAAVDALTRFRQAGGLVLLITNAPRPRPPVLEQLDSIGVSRNAYDGIVTSGEVARAALVAHGATRICHIGPERDLSLYAGLPVTLADPDGAEIISCTGLFDEDNETAEDYAPLLARMAARGIPMVCANPDLVVERGDRLIPCAGALAAIYDGLGGPTVLCGKPHGPIYDVAFGDLGRLAGREVARPEVLAIGDGLPTDIAGANRAGLDALFVTGGIHAIDYGTPDQPETALVRAMLVRLGLGARAFLPRLSW